MKFLLISPPYKLGIRFLVPEGMAIVKNLLNKKHQVKQIDLFMDIRKWNKKCTRKEYIDLNLFNNISLVEEYLLNELDNKKFDLELKKILRLIRPSQEEIIAFSIHCSSQLIFALLISKRIKKLYGNKIIFGGAYFFIKNKYVFDKFKWVDIVVSGYINKTSPQIMTYIKKERRALIINKEFDTNRSIYFCNAYSVNPLVIYDPKIIFNNIIELKKRHNVNHFIFTNQLINADYKNTEELCNIIIKSKLKIGWISYAHPNNLDENLINLMSKSGCLLLMFGLETASQSVQKLMNKNINVEHFKKVLTLLKKYNIQTALTLITGYPGETKEDFNKTLKFIKEYSNYINEATPIRIRVLHKSKLFKYGNYQIKISKKKSFLDKLVCEYQFFSNKISLKEQKRRLHESLKYIYRFIIRKEYPLFRLVPFLFFDLLYNKNLLFGNTTIYKLFNFICKFTSLDRYFKK